MKARPRPTQQELQAAIGLYQEADRVEAEDTSEPLYAIHRARRIARLPTRGEREASLARVPETFRGLVRYNLIECLAEQLGRRTSADGVDAFLAHVPLDMIEGVRARGRCYWRMR